MSLYNITGQAQLNLRASLARLVLLYQKIIGPNMWSERVVSWLLLNRILSNGKTRSASAEFAAIRAASLQAPTSEAWLFNHLRIFK